MADEAILAAKLLLDGGFYVSAVFFPTVPRGAAGLRICLTASHAQDDIRRLCGLIDAAQAWRAFDPAAQAGGMPCRCGSCRGDGPGDRAPAPPAGRGRARGGAAPASPRCTPGRGGGSATESCWERGGGAGVA